MKTFNNDQELKERLLKELKAHQLADRFVQGSWLQEKQGDLWRGCFYGCAMQTKEEPIKAFSETYWIDPWYCYLTERIFERLPKGEFETFPYESIEILPVGIDFNQIKSRFFTKLLTDQLQFCEGNEEVISAVNQCIKIFESPFDQIEKSAAESAARLAGSAARSAAFAAAESASAWSAESEAESAAAWSATFAAESATFAAAFAASSEAESAAWSAARSAESASSAAESAESARLAAGSEYYVKIKGFLFEAVKESKI